VIRAFFALLILIALHAQAAAPEIVVYKTATCGCCGKWVEHLKANGFTPVVKEVTSMTESRREHDVPAELASCHTAVVAGYTVEGHVPASAIKRLLKEKPKAKGLAVPGMPMGSPGMEGPRRDAYSVMLFQSDGRASVFESYPGDRRP
jgi:hypothetical protein